MRMPRHFRDFVPLVRIEYHFCLTSRANICNCTCEKIPILRSLYSTSSKNKAKIFGGENSQNAYIHIRTSLWNPFSTNDLIIVLVSLRKLGKKVSRNSLTELSSSVSPSTTRAHTPANSWKIRQRDSYSKTVLSGLFYFIEQTFSPLPFPRSQNSIPFLSFPFEISFPPFFARTKFNILLLAWFRLAISRSRARHLCTERRV